MVSQAELSYHSLVSGLLSIFLETVWVPLGLKANVKNVDMIYHLIFILCLFCIQCGHKIKILFQLGLYYIIFLYYKFKIREVF